MATSYSVSKVMSTMLEDIKVQSSSTPDLSLKLDDISIKLENLKDKAENTNVTITRIADNLDKQTNTLDTSLSEKIDLLKQIEINTRKATPSANVSSSSGSPSDDPNDDNGWATKAQARDILKAIKKGFQIDEYAYLKSQQQTQTATSMGGLGGLGSLIGGGIGGLLRGGGGFLSSFLSNPIKAIFSGLGKLDKGLGNIAAKAFQGTIGKILPKSLSNLVGRVLKMGLGKVFALGMAVFDFTQGFDKEKTKKLFGTDDFIHRCLSGVFEVIESFTFGLLSKETLKKGLDRALAFVQPLLDKLPQPIKEFFGLVFEHINNFGDFIVDFAMFIPNLFTKGWKKTTEDLKKKFDKMLGSFGNLLSKIVDNLGDFLKSLANKGIAALGKAFGVSDEKINALQFQLSERTGEAVPDSLPNTTNESIEVTSTVSPSTVAPTNTSQEDTSSVSTPSVNRGQTIGSSNLGTGIAGLGGFISHHESMGDYNAYNKGAYHGYARNIFGKGKAKTIDFSKLTVGQVYRLQTLPVNHPDKLFAVGKYQIIPSTMKLAMGYLGLSGNEPFTPQLQDQMFTALIMRKRPKIGKFITGDSDDLEGAAYAAALEWASIGAAKYGDKSVYNKDGVNKAFITSAQIKGALIKARNEYMASRGETKFVDSNNYSTSGINNTATNVEVTKSQTINTTNGVSGDTQVPNSSISITSIGSMGGINNSSDSTPPLATPSFRGFGGVQASSPINIPNLGSVQLPNLANILQQSGLSQLGERISNQIGGLLGGVTQGSNLSLESIPMIPNNIDLAMINMRVA